MNPKMMSKRNLRNFSIAVLVASFLSPFAWNAQVVGQDNTILNGGMEVVKDGGEIAEWQLFGRNDDERAQWGIRYVVDTKNPYSGNNCLLIDATEFRMKGISAIQQLDATEYAGKRVRLSAVIRGVAIPEDMEVEDIPGRAYASINITRNDHSGYWRTLAVESMPRRLIRDGDWNHHYIVIDVPANAEDIEVRLEVHGNTKGWFDQVSLEVVPGHVELTTPSVFDDPQPFFNWWLIFPAIILPIFCLSFFGTSFLHRVALRFTVAYWLIYFFTWWLYLLSFAEIDFSDYFAARNGVVNWLAWSIFEKDIYPFGSGSGDTLFNYVELLSILMYSVGITIVWSFIDWRRTDHAWVKDSFRSFLRYSLAFVLLSYGLAKLNPETSQFQAPSFDRMTVSYGDSSPMGLLWTFMGASQPYSIFGGAAEVVAALLLIWRRTAVVGAFAAIGVMTNVVMLNYCYDVPVKLFSSHLLFAGFLVLLPDLHWVANAFFLHRSAERSDLAPPYVGARSVWYFRGLQALIIGLGIVYPIWETIDGWVEARNPDCFGEYFVEEFRSPYLVTDEDDVAEESQSATKESPLKKITLRRLPFPFDDEQEEGFTDVISVRSESASENYQATVSFDRETQKLEIIDFDGQKPILPDEIQIRVIDEDHIELSGQMEGGDWFAKLSRRKEEFELTSRGFHWISPRPANR